MAAGLVDSAKRNVTRVALYVPHALLSNWTATDTDRGPSGWIKEC
jgi:hypothetical protein